MKLEARRKTDGIGSYGFESSNRRDIKRRRRAKTSVKSSLQTSRPSSRKVDRASSAEVSTKMGSHRSRGTVDTHVRAKFSSNRWKRGSHALYSFFSSSSASFKRKREDSFHLLGWLRLRVPSKNKSRKPSRIEAKFDALVDCNRSNENFA